MDRARLMELLDAYLDRRLDSADRAALSAELAASPDACRIFWESIHQHALLAELLAEARGVALAQQEKASCAPPDIKLFSPTEKPASAPTVPPASQTGHVLRRWVGPGAAAVLFALGLSWLIGPSPAPDEPSFGAEVALARLGELHGDVEIVAEEARSPARTGQIVHAGQEVHTGEGSSVVVSYDDSSTLELIADTAVQLLPQSTPDGAAQGGKRIFLVKGVVNANVTPQPRGRPMVVSTKHADLLAPGSRFSSASVLGEMRIELEAGKAQLMSKGDPRAIEIHTGSYAVAGCDGEVINPAPMLPTSGEPYATFAEPRGPILALAALSDRLLAVGCFNGVVKLFDPRTRKIRGQLDARRFRTLALAGSRDGRTLAAGYESKNKNESGVLLWDLPRRRLLRDLPGARNTPALGFTPDGLTLVFTGKGQRGVSVWDTTDHHERITLGDRLERVQCLAISPDGRTVAAGCPDGKIRLWNLQTGRIETILEGSPREVQALAFHPGGGLLASGSRDGAVRLWSLPGGDEVRILSGNFKEVRCLTFSPDGTTLATSHGGTAVLWNITTGKQRSTLKAHKFAITALTYLPDGNTLVTAGWDRIVKLWDLQPSL